ncbi:family 16 glycoside hydrolase [Streptomyces sp. M10(2022)]
MVHIRSPRPFASADGEQLWSTEAWYTLNARPGPEAPVTAYDAESARLSGERASTPSTAVTPVAASSTASAPRAQLPPSTSTHLRKAATTWVALRQRPRPLHRYQDDRRQRQWRAVAADQPPSTGGWNRWSTRPERLGLRKGHNTITYTYRPEDTGHVNLDMIEVRRPGSRIDLFSGGSVSTGWQHTDGRSVEWPHTAENSIEVCCGDIRTKQAFGDFRLHAEFRCRSCRTTSPGRTEATAASTSRSGTKSRSWTPSEWRSSPRTRPHPSTTKGRRPERRHRPETWQTYDIVFRAARFDTAGKKTDDARITVVWNGRKVHDNVAVDGPTGNGDAELAAAGAIRLQDHGNKVRFRNLWIEPLG